MTGSDASLGGLPIAAGDVLLKKYRVERLVGEGGTGVVLLATHLQLEQRVAIKFLRRGLADDDLRTRFEREARAIGTIESDHVVIVLDAGALEDGAPYMVMEYLDGRDLARVLKEDGPLPIERAVDCMIQVCSALAEAHESGIVHRDLKPANLFLTRRDDGRAHVKVVDFGISKVFDKGFERRDGRASDVTGSYAVLGSPRWMAPEQLLNARDVDGRADLWSVGAVLFYLVTGQHAFAAEDNVQAGAAVLSAEPRRLRELAPHAPAALEAIVSRCLTRDLSSRFQSATELAHALLPFASDDARESLERLELVKAPPASARGSVADASTSVPSFELLPGSMALPSGTRDTPTERRVRRSEGTGARAGSPIEGPPIGSPRRASMLRVALLGLAVVVVVLAGGLATKTLGRRGAVSVPLDAAKRSP